MSPKPHVSPDSFFHETSSHPQHQTLSQSPPITIYFISGNPGLISYYHPFLSLLTEKLSASDAAGPSSPSSFHIFGHSLAGFELTQDPQIEPLYHSLEDQICFVQRRLKTHMANLAREGDWGDVVGMKKERPRVILMGHSVGSYIAMEVLRRHQERKVGSDDGQGDFDVVGGVMLFPTVVDIAKSPSGQKLTILLRFIPQLAVVVAVFARILTTIFPEVALRALIRFVMRSPPEDAVDTTLSFLTSRHGVRQALHLAGDEMRTITSDKWSDDVWGMSVVKEKTTRLLFYFGRNDHWVAERTRDEIVELRGRTDKGPKMIVCEDSLPHAFCLRHNDAMSSRVADMITSIVTNQPISEN